MNASGRLNTCKSNGNSPFGELTSGKRVRNTYATYPFLGDSPKKFGLISHSIAVWHQAVIKEFRKRIGVRPIR